MAYLSSGVDAETGKEQFKEIILSEAYRTIAVVDGAKQVTVPVVQAVVRAVAVNAAKGSHRAQRLFAELVADVERANRALHDRFLRTAIDYKESWERAIADARRRGMPAPDPVPHPDDILIIPSTGEVRIQGPMTKEQRAAGLEMIRRLEASEQEIAELRADRAKARGPAKRAVIDELIAHEEKIAALMRDHIIDVEWVPFIARYRTMCIAPSADFRRILENVREFGLAA